MSEISQILNRLSSVFNRAMTDVVVAENHEDVVSHLKNMSIIFTETCTIAENCAAEKEAARREAENLREKCQKLQTKANSFDDAIQQLHLALNSKNQGIDRSSKMIFEKIKEEVEENMKKIENLRKFQSFYEIEKERSIRMSKHIDELSKMVVMQRIGSRFFAREVAAVRQQMDLVRQARSVESAAKSRVWDEIETENAILRVNTLWLINRINGNDRTSAPFEENSEIHCQPRVVILMRSHPHQGLGLEITGGCKTFRPIIVSGKLKGSMADDDELRLGDRIIAIDGLFVTNTTTHDEVMRILENESSKDYLALVVSAFDPWRRTMAAKNEMGGDDELFLENDEKIEDDEDDDEEEEEGGRRKKEGKID